MTIVKLLSEWCFGRDIIVIEGRVPDEPIIDELALLNTGFFPTPTINKGWEKWELPPSPERGYEVSFWLKSIEEGWALASEPFEGFSPLVVVKMALVGEYKELYLYQTSPDGGRKVVRGVPDVWRERCRQQHPELMPEGT